MSTERPELIRYGHLIALLHVLMDAGLLSIEDAQNIKKIIMKKYRILSDYSA